eukprot:SAG31_NODE_1558_length_7885_cov_2.567300_3_plen_127_part_00
MACTLHCRTCDLVPRAAVCSEPPEEPSPSTEPLPIEILPTASFNFGACARRVVGLSFCGVFTCIRQLIAATNGITQGNITLSDMREDLGPLERAQYISSVVDFEMQVNDVEILPTLSCHLEHGTGT